MQILLAPDKFKGTFSGRDIADHLQAAIETTLPQAIITRTPISDGGDGFMQLMCEASEREIRTCIAQDALSRERETHYALCGNTAVIEMAQASGLHQIEEQARDVLRSSTYGTGQLICHAIDSGASRILIGIGGSATNDAGCGMAAALGVKFLNAEGGVCQPHPLGLLECTSIDVTELRPHPPVIVACDVDNPLLGARGATAIYAPQKGATHEQLPQLEAALSKVVSLTNSIDTAEAAGAGAAGGLGFGLMHFLNAELVSGFDLVAQELCLEQKIIEADLIITGEGKLDGQTSQGKGPAGVAQLARRHNKPIIAIAGSIEDDAASLFDHCFSLHQPDQLLSETIRRSHEILPQVCQKIAHYIASRSF